MSIQFSLFSIVGILITVAVVVGVIQGIRYIIRSYKQAKFNDDSMAKKWLTVTILCVVIMLLSWIFNMGWYRVILTWIPLPLIHTIIFLRLNIKASYKVSSYKSLGKYMVLSCITYLLPYLFFPDGGDLGEMYLFFGLIRNNTVANIMVYIASIALSLNIAALILEYKELRKCVS